MMCIYKAVKDFVPRGGRRGLERGRPKNDVHL